MLIADATARAFAQAQRAELEAFQSFAPADPAAADSVPAAAPQGAYFMMQGDRGRVLYAPGGAFELRGGVLVDASGATVLGYPAPGAPLQPLQVNAIDRALGFGGDLRIDAAGTATYARATVDPRTGRRDVQRAVLGRLALARFAPGTKLQAIDGRRFAAPSGIAPHAGVAGDGNFAQLAPLPLSQNPNALDSALARMQEAYIAIDALRAAGVAQDGVEKTAMGLLK